VNTARSGSSVAVGGQRVELSAEADGALDGVAGERVVLGFRPESVAIGGEIPAVIRAIEHEGQTLAVVATVAAPFPGIIGAVHVFDPGGPRLTTSRVGVPSLPV
jgi:hypothetical protein